MRSNLQRSIGLSVGRIRTRRHINVNPATTSWKASSTIISTTQFRSTCWNGRSYSSSPVILKNATKDELKGSEEHGPENPAYYRLKGIEMHPDSISQFLFPDGSVPKRKVSIGSKTSSADQRRPIEWEYGYFWMLRELRNTDDKPVLSNHELIPDDISQRMPLLKVTPMAEGQNEVMFPDGLIQNNRSQDPAAQCTLVAVSFRDLGYKMIPDWLLPVQDMYSNNNRVQCIKINMSEGGWLFRAMAPMLKWMVNRNTSAEERLYTYLYYGDEEDLKNFQLKMGFHNVVTCFVFLLDGIGRVRWVASGPPNEEELQRLLHHHIPLILPKARQPVKPKT